MFRFLTFLMGREFEECKSCQTLKEQLNYERSEKKQLTQTLLNILQPKTVEAAPTELLPIAQSSGMFARRRAVLEARDREEAKILQEKRHLGMPDNLAKPNVVITDTPNPNPASDPEIERLERQVGIGEGA